MAVNSPPKSATDDVLAGSHYMALGAWNNHGDKPSQDRGTVILDDLKELARQRVQVAVEAEYTVLRGKIGSIRAEMARRGVLSSGATVSRISSACLEAVNAAKANAWTETRSVLVQGQVAFDPDLADGIKSFLATFSPHLAVVLTGIIDKEARVISGSRTQSDFSGVKQRIDQAIRAADHKVGLDVDLFVLGLQGSGTGGSTAAPGSGVYVNGDRIDELRAITGGSFDLRKLIRSCEELNICYTNGCHLATIMLVRSVLDHVPPVFGYKSFAEVSSNYGGSRSFKQAMLRLEYSSRKIADMYLHGQVRQEESLPNATQVDFSNEIDLLLAEVVRILRQAPGEPTSHAPPST